MGGSSKKVTVGYKYYIGMHMVLCHGPVDRIQNIRVDERTAWQGFIEGGRININANNLFGGEDREGGISGAVDIDMGRPGQGKNSYLVARLGQNIPAFRGVVSAVLRQVYVGLNPYLKPWAFRLQRVYSRSGGAAQWYPERAPIGELSQAALYFALDVSGSMSGTRLQSMKDAINGVLANFVGIGPSSPVDIRVVAFSGGATAIERRNVSGQDVQDIINWVNARGASGGTNFEAAVQSAPNFFAGSGSKPRIMFFVTDGQSTGGSLQPSVNIVRSISNLSVYGFNIELSDTSETAQLDNTPQDGVPVVTGGNPGPLQQAILNALYAIINLNPAHIIHESLTDSDWGMGYLQADLDDASFRAAADTLYGEFMGISILWDRQLPLEDFIQEILKHIDGVLRVNRRTGKFELKLVRDDYDEAELIELGPWNVESISEFNRPAFGELVNSVTANYWDGRSGKDASLTVQDLALTEAQRATINTTVQYPGFTNASLVSRVAERDLRTLSTPLVSCTLYCNQDARDLNVGDAFKLTWPDYSINGLVMRVTQIAYGNGRSNKIKITASQDAYAMPEVIQFEPEEPAWEDPDEPPQPAQRRLVTEMPYYELVQRAGQTFVDAELSANPEVGYLMVSAGRPTSAHINARLATDGAGGIFEEAKVIDFSPTALLHDDIGPLDTLVQVNTGFDLDLVVPGPWAEINGEMVGVVSLDIDTGLMEIRRGVLDTVPRAHAAGSTVIFADEYVDDDESEYVLSDEVGVAILPATGQGAITLGAAPIDYVEIAARAIRPYRPGNLRAFGELDPSPDVYPTYPVEVTWSHRNRRTETAPSFTEWTAGNITPEDGTDYRVLVEAIQDDGTLDGVVDDAIVTGTSYSLTEATIGETYAGSPFMRVTVTARRDGWDSWQSPSIRFRGPFREPTNLFAVYRDMRPPENLSGVAFPEI